MKCPSDVYSNIKKALNNKLSDLSNFKEEVTSEGGSNELTSAFIQNLLSNVRDPESILSALTERKEILSNPFHKAFIKEVGEELYVGNHKHYVLSTKLMRSDDLGEVSLVVKLAPANNISAATNHVFSLDSDTSKPYDKVKEITIDGLSFLATKAIKEFNKTNKEYTTEDVTIDAFGDKETKATLDKMDQVNTILGSRRNLNGDSLIGYEKITDYEHGNIESMRNILNKLHVLGDSAATEAEMRYYNMLLDKMHPRFFNHMDLYLKKNAVDTVGEVQLETSRIVIDVAAKAKRGARVQSEAEVYMHELIHAMTAWAFRQKDFGIRRQQARLNHAMAVAKQKLTWKDFLDVDLTEATPADIQAAKDMESYIFNSKYALEEFLAYAMTSPKLMDKLKELKMSDGDKKTQKPETVFERVFDVFKRVFDGLFGRFDFRKADTSLFDEVHNLAFELAEINNHHRTELLGKNPGGQLADVLNNADDVLAAKLNDYRAKIAKAFPDQKHPGENATAYERAKYILDFSVKVFTSPSHRGFFGLMARTMWIKPGNTIREIMSGFFERDQVFRIAEKLNMLSNQIDVVRNSIISATSQKINRSFSRRLSVEEDSAITTVLLDTNLSSLRYRRLGRNKLSDKDTIELLTDDEALYKREGRVKHRIKELLRSSDKRAKWTTEQAISLGYFMATGKGHTALNTNADNIVKGFGLNERFEYYPALASAVNELAVLTAVRYTNEKDKQLVAELIKSETKGINVITDTYETYKTQSERYVFKNNTAHMMAGHTKELFDDSVDIVIEPVANREELEQRGLKLQYELKSHPQDKYAGKMAVYTSNPWGKRERLRGTVGLGKLHAKGTTMSNLKSKSDPGLSDALFRRDFANVMNSSFGVHEAMMNGTFDVSNTEYGLVPLYNTSGRVTDYRYTMTKENKEKLLHQDKRASQVLPRSIANIEHQLRRNALDKEALEAIKEDMRTNWEEGEIGLDGYSEYLLIGPNSEDNRAKDLYNLLPDNFRQYINSRSDKQMAVRADLVNIYFGYQQLKTSDIPGVKLLPGFVTSTIDTVEGMWQELVKISKGAILLKMPAILAWNMLSNVFLQISAGALDVPQLIRDYKESTSEVNEYIKTNRKLNQLTVEIAQDKESLRRVKNSKVLSDKIHNKTVEAKRLKRMLESNPVKELFDAGLYQSHVEEIENSALNETNRIAKYTNSKLDKLPPAVKTIAEVAYLTQNTKWYVMSQEVMQRTDMISRQVQNKIAQREEAAIIRGEKNVPLWWKELKGDNYPNRKEMTGKEAEQFKTVGKQMRLEALMDNYINYTLPNGRGEEYLNRMGVLMFTKYLKRVQRVILNIAGQNPLKSAVAMGVGVAALDADIIQNQSLIARGFDNSGDFSLGNIVPVYSPFYHLDNVLTPAILKEELYFNAF